MSDPNRSSPSQWSADGPGTLVGVTCPDHSAEPGAYGVRRGANTATRTNTATMIAPAMALGLRRTRRNAPRQRLTPWISSSASPRAAGGPLAGGGCVLIRWPFSFWASSCPDPGVDHTVGDVDDEIDQGVH